MFLVVKFILIHEVSDMKRTFTKVLALCVCAVMLVGCFAGCSSKKDDCIVIGLTGPLTGGASIYGIAVKNSAQLAVDEINEAGGLNGVKFKLDMRDDEHNPENVANLYAGLVKDGMQVALGTVTTKPGLEFKNLAKEDNVFFLTPSATGDAIPEFDNGYQMCFSDSNQGTAAAKFFNENYKGKKVGIFYKADDEYSKGIYDNFKSALDSSFNEELKEASFTGDASTFDSQINTLKGCEVVFMPIYYTPASQFMTQANNVENSIATYYGCDGFDGIDAIDGFDINTIPQEISMLSHFNSTAPDGPAAEFIEKYNDKYDEEKEPLNQFGAAAYDCVYAIYEAMKVAVENGKEIDAKTSASDVCEILKEVFNSDDFTYRGITGKCEGDERSYISWSEDGTVVKEAIKYIVKEKSAA